MFKVTVTDPSGAGIEVLKNRRSGIKAAESALADAVEAGLDVDHTTFTVTVAPTKPEVRFIHT